MFGSERAPAAGHALLGFPSSSPCSQTALAAADVGVALGSGTHLAGDAADAVVSDLRDVPAVFAIAEATRRRIRGNLGWAFCYNLAAIPLAAAGLINPLLAAVAMAASSLLVVANSARSLGSD